MPDTLRQALQHALGDNFVVGRELGGGGMSQVFVARDAMLGREVAIKVLAPDVVEGLSVERFAREIRMAAGLQEPHIVPVLTAGSTASGLPYYTMPFVEGESLRARMAKGLVSATDAVSILRDVAKALAYAHARNIVHRDIKPENILLSNGTAVVTDFGIAKALEVARTHSSEAARASSITRTGTSIGTPAYMAPEQAAGDPATDQRADIYSWGVVAYELLSGRHPFAGKTTPQLLMAAHFSETPVSLGATSDGVTPQVAALVMRCLAKDPAARPVDASALLRVLSETSTTSSMPTSKQWPAIGALFIALMAFGFVLWIARRHDAVGDVAATTTAAGPVMMAVLPFEHMGPADQQPFTDGLTDAVTSKLAGLASLAVIDRRSAATYRGTTKPAKQIGSELGVRYLLEGVVRWANDGAGALKARVTPTLVDAQTGVTKWTGDPQDITLDDPFTAQGRIAADVAQAMEVAVLPTERVKLIRRFSDNPQAFAAYQRGRAMVDAANRSSSANNPSLRKQSASEFERAVSLDSNFSEAWANLAIERLYLTQLERDNHVAELDARRAVIGANLNSSTNPLVRIATATSRIIFDHDTAGADSLIEKAVRDGSNDAFVLVMAADLMRFRGHLGRAFQLMQRAATLDPRATNVLTFAGAAALSVGRWDDASRFANAAIALDSADELGWQLRISLSLARGDSVRAKSEMDAALSHFEKPSNVITQLLPYVGSSYARRFLALTTNEVGPTTLQDSVYIYLGGKSDAGLLVGDTVLARVYSDSIASLYRKRIAYAAKDLAVRQTAMFANANLNLVPEARILLDACLAEARALSAQDYPTFLLDPATMAGTYARLGETSIAIKWLEAGLQSGYVAYAPAAYVRHPKLQVLRGRSEFLRFLKAHPE